MDKGVPPRQNNTEIWTQEISGFVNMDSRLWVDRLPRGAKASKTTPSQHAFLQAMRDWVLMRSVSTLAIASRYEFASGFPISVQASSGDGKTMYDLETCAPVSREELCVQSR